MVLQLMDSHLKMVFTLVLGVTNSYSKGLMEVISRDLPNLAPKVSEDDTEGISLQGAQWKELC
jgi:hypothetical protein